MAGEVGTYSAGRSPGVEWSELERVLLQRPGWRRSGSELKGPCPLCGGRDRCWARPGDTASVLLTCRVCEAPFGELLAAVGDFNTPERQLETYKPPLAQSRRPLDHLVALWAAGEPAESGTAGGRYLARRTGCTMLPPSVRWCPADRWPRLKGIRPLPTGATGALLYRFTSASDPAGAIVALQIEAVSQNADPVRFDPAPNEDEPRKRPNVGGSLMAGRALVACRGDRTGRTHLVEGPIDALGVVELLGRDTLRRTGDTVIGAPGTSGFSVQTVSSYAGPVTLWTDGDDGGYLAAMRLARALRRLGRGVELRAAPKGQDWADVAREMAEEREAIRCD